MADPEAKVVLHSPTQRDANRILDEMRRIQERLQAPEPDGSEG